MSITLLDRPFPIWVINEEILPQGLYEEIGLSFAKTLTPWKYYDNVVERKCLVDSANDVGPIAQKSCSIDWLSLLRRWTPIPTEDLQLDPSGYGGSIHALRPGDYLGCHLDREIIPGTTLELKVAIVAFVVPFWNKVWGGELQFWDSAARKVVSAVEPALGRIVVWQPSNISYHSVSQVAYSCPIFRAGVNAFCYGPKSSTAVRQRALFVPPRV